MLSVAGPSVISTVKVSTPLKSALGVYLITWLVPLPLTVATPLAAGPEIDQLMVSPSTSVAFRVTVPSVSSAVVIDAVSSVITGASFTPLTVIAKLWLTVSEPSVTSTVTSSRVTPLAGVQVITPVTESITMPSGLAVRLNSRVSPSISSATTV